MYVSPVECPRFGFRSVGRCLSFGACPFGPPLGALGPLTSFWRGRTLFTLEPRDRTFRPVTRLLFACRGSLMRDGVTSKSFPASPVGIPDVPRHVRVCVMLVTSHSTFSIFVAGMSGGTVCVPSSWEMLPSSSPTLLCRIGPMASNPTHKTRPQSSLSSILHGWRDWGPAHFLATYQVTNICRMSAFYWKF